MVYSAQGGSGVIDLSPERVESLNQELSRLDTDGRLRHMYSLLGEDMIATTSFGKDSGLLLHHLYRLNLPIRVFFIDTTFHFPETLDYRTTLAQNYGLRLVEGRSEDPDNQRYAMRVAHVVRIRDTDACCAINKVAVQARYLARDDVKGFLTGIRRSQSESRKDTPFVRLQRSGKLKICPFADWPQSDVDLYLKLREVPEHPLAQKGYTSIGCAPGTCTTKPTGGDERSGRWAGQDKTECGLHLDYNL